MNKIVRPIPLNKTKLKVVSKFKPSGDQPKAIEQIVQRVNNGEKDTVLLGATGTGKSATIAWVLEKLQRPALVLAHNKTLAAQLANEFRELFPNNKIEYFVSYYDYFQPEAYIPQTDTYIEKDASINSEIERLRHSATCSLLTRRDTIVVSSVSCIYGLGEPDEYINMMVKLVVGQQIDRNKLIKQFVQMQYKRNDIDFTRGTFRVRGDVLEIIPVYEELAIRIEFFGNEIENISILHPVSAELIENTKEIFIFPASHYVASQDKMQNAIEKIREELEETLKQFKKEGKLLEAQRLKVRTEFDLEMIEQVGYCNGIENYSRHIDGRAKGTAPSTLLSCFPDDFVMVIDESHVTIPQIGAMYMGDRSRKKMLVEHGFRLPSCMDNRPLKWEEFLQKIGQSIYMSATPAKYELDLVENSVVEQIIRPTGLLDPKIEVMPTHNQIQELIKQINKAIELKQRVLVTTLTKKMAEQLTEYLANKNIPVKYLHSEIDTITRVEILAELRKGDFSVLVGINLLREGLDLPEVSLVAILDADKQGFLRSQTSLIQTIGRAARNVNGKVIMFADNVTDAMEHAITETNRRRKIQEEYNKQHNISPQSIRKKINSLALMLDSIHSGEISPINKQEKTQTITDSKTLPALSTIKNNKFIVPGASLTQLIEELTKQMELASQELNFELAAKIRDEILELKKQVNQIKKATN